MRPLTLKTPESTAGFSKNPLIITKLPEIANPDEIKQGPAFFVCVIIKGVLFMCFLVYIIHLDLYVGLLFMLAVLLQYNY